MKILCRETYELAPEGVDAASDKLALALQSHTGLKSREVLRLRLSMEEILLNWMQTDRGGQVKLHMEQQGKKLNISLELKSRYQNAVKNPLKNAEEYGNSGMADNIMANLGMGWMYQMTDGVNRVFIKVPAKTSSQVVSMGLAIVTAVVTGMLLKVLPAGVRELSSAWLIEPLFATFLGFLSAIVAPMMCLSVVWGVFSIGNPRQLGAIGRKVCIRFLRENTVAALLGGVMLALFFPFKFQSASGSAGQIEKLLEMLYDIVPDNLIAPFLSGNTLQIIFLALLVGITMIVIQNQVPLAAGFIEQCNAIVQQILTAISRLVPAFVYLSILRLVLSEGLGNLGGFAKMLLLYLAGCLILIGYYTLVVSGRLHVSPKLLIKKLLPTYLIGLTTGSSAAAFSECTSACIEKLGIKKRLVNFGVPLGIVVYMPNFALWLVLLGGACAQYYGMVLTPVDILTAVFIGVFLAVTAPPIPGGGLTCYTILLMQMNIPLEILAVASAINVIMDFTATAGNLFANQTALLLEGSRLGMVDMEKLHKTI